MGVRLLSGVPNMTIDEVADILYGYIKNYSCPQCSGSLALEVRRKQGDLYTKQIMTVTCKGCGLSAVCNDYVPVEMLNNKIMLKGRGEKVRLELENILEKFHRNVAERLMESV